MKPLKTVTHNPRNRHERRVAAAQARKQKKVSARSEPKRADPNRRKRHVLAAIRAGARLLYDKRNKFWMLMHEGGKRERVKARVVEYLQEILLIAYNRTFGRWTLTRGGECAVAAL